MNSLIQWVFSSQRTL